MKSDLIITWSESLYNKDNEEIWKLELKIRNLSPISWFFQNIISFSNQIMTDFYKNYRFINQNYEIFKEIFPHKSWPIASNVYSHLWCARAHMINICSKDYNCKNLSIKLISYIKSTTPSIHTANPSSLPNSPHTRMKLNIGTLET